MWERERERETTNIQIVEAFWELARDLRTKNKIKCIILEEKTETKPKLREKEELKQDALVVVVKAILQ